MKNFVVLAISLLSFGCTHLSVSNPALITRIEHAKSTEDLTAFPMNLEADMSCTSTRSGDFINRRCTNEFRIADVVKVFRENGLNPIPPKEGETAPKLSVNVKDLNGFLEGTTGFFNIITLGLVPLYHHTDYIVSYSDPVKNINISENVRFASSQSWFSLFRTTKPEALKNTATAEGIAEENLIRKVIEKAQLVN